MFGLSSLTITDGWSLYRQLTGPPGHKDTKFNLKLKLNLLDEMFINASKMLRVTSCLSAFVAISQISFISFEQKKLFSS